MTSFRFTPANFRCEGDFLDQLPEDPPANPNPEWGLCELSVGDGKERAAVEFVLDHERMTDAELLDQRYQGEGIYLKNHYRGGGDVVPLWVVIRSREFTRSRIRHILQFIATILVSGDYKHAQFWEIR